MAVTLEFSIPSTSTSSVRLFQAPSGNHFKTNKFATHEQLQLAFDNGLPDLTPGSYSKMINHINKEEWLETCLLKNENSQGKQIVLIMEEQIHTSNPDGTRWLKVVIYDSFHNHYLLRSITNKFYNNISQKNPNWNKQSKNENWWICLSTIGTDIEFFNTLRDVLGY